MAKQTSGGLSDDELQRLLGDDNAVPPASQGAVSVEEALDTAFQAMEQRTGATDQASQETNGAVTGETVRTIFGTSQDISEVMKRIFAFLRSFKKESAPLGSEAYYIRVLQQVRIRYTPSDEIAAKRAPSSITGRL